MKYPVYALMVLLLFGGPVQADDKGEVSDILKKHIDAVLVTLKDKSMDKPLRDKKIIEIITPIFDFKRMATLSLGKKHWTGISKEKQGTYSDLFIKSLQESYLEKLNLYSDEEMAYEEAKQVKSRVHIMTHLVSPDNNIDMFYKFYKSKGGWKIYDVEVQGVSIIQTYRTQFNDVLKDGTIDTLIARLQKKGEFKIADPEKKSN